VLFSGDRKSLCDTIALDIKPKHKNIQCDKLAEDQ